MIKSEHSKQQSQRPKASLLADAIEQIETKLSTERLVRRGITFVIASTVIFAAAGAAAGWGMAAILPRFLENVFEATGDKLWQIGVGYGLVFGLVFGAVVGCVVWITAAMYRSRIKRNVLLQLKTERG
jgi:hypothetical protein